MNNINGLFVVNDSYHRDVTRISKVRGGNKDETNLSSCDQ